jgi:hypothetical protein
MHNPHRTAAQHNPSRHPFAPSRVHSSIASPYQPSIIDPDFDRHEHFRDRELDSNNLFYVAEALTHVRNCNFAQGSDEYESLTEQINDSKGPIYNDEHSYLSTPAQAAFQLKQISIASSLSTVAAQEDKDRCTCCGSQGHIVAACDLKDYKQWNQLHTGVLNTWALAALKPQVVSIILDLASQHGYLKGNANLRLELEKQIAERAAIKEEQRRSRQQAQGPYQPGGYQSHAPSSYGQNHYGPPRGASSGY